MDSSAGRLWVGDPGKSLLWGLSSHQGAKSIRLMHFARIREGKHVRYCEIYRTPD